MGLNDKANAALIYLALYTIIFVLIILGYSSRHLKLCSRYSVLNFHGTARARSPSYRPRFRDYKLLQSQPANSLLRSRWYVLSYLK